MYFTEEIITKWYLGKYNKGRAVALRRCARNIQFDGTLIIAVCVWQPRTHHARFFSPNSIDCNPSKKPAFWNSTFLFENPFLWRVFQVTSWYLYVYRFVNKRTIFIFCYRTNKWISYTASSLKHFLHNDRSISDVQVVLTFDCDVRDQAFKFASAKFELTISIEIYIALSILIGEKMLFPFWKELCTIVLT